MQGGDPLNGHLVAQSLSLGFSRQGGDLLDGVSPGPDCLSGVSHTRW